MSQVPAEALPLLTRSEIRSNFIVEILTPVVRRFTPYRGLTADGRRGLIVEGNYYKAAIVEVPAIEESDDVSPVRASVSIGNADNANTDLYSDPANFKCAIRISKVWFTDAAWSESVAPSLVVQPWFEGRTGRPALRGERIEIDCIADTGRRGITPRTKSRNLMTAHQPITAGQKLTILTRAA
ncbi:MAG: hypothetical protein ACTHQM_25750 [Thermoanaerobaculia bacterium]